MDNLNSKEWARYNKDVIWIDDSPWQIRNKMLLPISRPHRNENINKEKVRDALSKSGALLAHWSDEWNSSESEWWWTCCDNKFYDLESIRSASTRRDVRKGLRECSIQKIDPLHFSEIGYDVYKESRLSYGFKNSQIITKNEFHEETVLKSKYSGFEIWGAFVRGELAAYSTPVTFDNATDLGSTVSRRIFYKHNPNNALFFYLTKYYLQKKEVYYITNGYRTLLHPTTINDLLIRSGYKKVYCRLNIVLTNTAKVIANFKILNFLQTYFEKKFPHQTAQLNGFYKLLQISQSFKWN